MTDKYQNKYRIPSARLASWDYGSNAAYFVTICTAGMEDYFGEIVNGEMHLSPIGNIVESEWLKTPSIRPDMNLYLDEFVVMPNHFHGIIEIGENPYNRNSHTDRDMRRDAMHCVSTTTQTPAKNKFGPQSKNLASIIRGFKSAVSTSARIIQPNFAWQARFHDHIIRNEEEYKRIVQYIKENPQNWDKDKFFKAIRRIN